MLQENKDNIYERGATAHSKNAIFFWILVGIIWAFFDKNINLLSSIGFLLFLPGVLVASFASMPLFLLRNKIALNIIEKRQESLAILIPILNILDIIEMIVAPVIYLKILSSFL